MLTIQSILRQNPRRYARPSASRACGCRHSIRWQTTTAPEVDEDAKIIPAEERVHRFFRHGLDELYPRTKKSEDALSVPQFRRKYNALKNGQIIEKEKHIVRGTSKLDPMSYPLVLILDLGRINTVRSGSAKLFFFDIEQAGHKLQAVCSYASLQEPIPVDQAIFKSRCHDLGRGDIISMPGIVKF